jgi:hypothetical protein
MKNQELKRYDEFTREDFKNADSDELVEAVIQWLYSKIDNWGNEVEIVQSWSEPRRYAYASATVFKEIGGGGIHQIYFNATREFLHDAIIAYKEMNLPVLEAALEEAQTIYKLHADDFRGWNDGNVETFLKSKELGLFQHLDNVFITHKSQYYDQFAAFIRAHVEDFGTDSDEVIS